MRDKDRRLLLFKAERIQLQSLPVLAHCPDYFRRESLSSSRLDLYCDLDVGVNDSGQPLNDLLGYLGRIAGDPQRIELGRGVEPPRRSRWRGHLEQGLVAAGG